MSKMKAEIEKTFRELIKYGIDNPKNNYEAMSNASHFKHMLETLPKKSGIKCLELGFGRGVLALLLKNVLGYNVYGVEHPSRAFLKEKHFKNFIKKEKFELRNTDMVKNKLDFDDDEFDVVTFSEVIEHLDPKDLELVFKEIRRVLKKDGLFMLTTINRRRLANIIEKKSKDTYNQYEETHGHIKEYTSGELVSLLESHGLKVVKVRMSNFSYLNPVIDLVNNTICWFIPKLRNDSIVLAQNFKKP